ncbi:MAG: arginine--tRNA ligase, partial [Bdellovibrionales bacterium]|nr:arginine--tRNA ligase [Bdellovibrionales bacterium]
WAKDKCHHVSFGMYRFGEFKMSTRKGNVIFLEDVLNKAVEMVATQMREKNPDLEGLDEIAETIG